MLIIDIVRSAVKSCYLLVLFKLMLKGFVFGPHWNFAFIYYCVFRESNMGLPFAEIMLVYRHIHCENGVQNLNTFLKLVLAFFHMFSLKHV